MKDIHQILKDHWGFENFRPLQEDIVSSAMEGKDTLALLPTGGGKSLCYQVPGIAMEGMCLVVSPLIALMKDQVASLQEKGVMARALVSGMDKREIDISLDNCIYGKTKFLYVSPERLQSDLFIERFKKMKVNLIAVDEAHCISQWGYDFRPSYSRIAEVREYTPDTPVLALTATATPDVVDDIQEKLEFREKNVFHKSFSRENLAYVVRKIEDKRGKMLEILNKIPGTSVVYVRNRKKTRSIAEFLSRKGITAAHYHAGLSKEKRDELLDQWLKNKIRVMVSTNAFGMGIDKPDVRTVIHLDLPDSPEAYFQEAGRAGRDGTKSFATLLFHEEDKREMESRTKAEFPPFDQVKKVYNALGNYFRIAYGAGMNETFPINIREFADNYGWTILEVHNAIKILELEGYIAYLQDFGEPSKVRIKVRPNELYDLQVRNPKISGFIDLLLRSYSGLFEDLTIIDEQLLSKRSGWSPEQVRNALEYLQRMNVLEYIPRSDLPKITYLVGRQKENTLSPTRIGYHGRKEAMEKRRNAILSYAMDNEHCRSQMLLDYFGEKNSGECGICDVCVERKKTGVNKVEFEHLSDRVQKILREKPADIKGLKEELGNVEKEKLLTVVQWLLDNHHLQYDPNNRLVLKPDEIQDR